MQPQCKIRQNSICGVFHNPGFFLLGVSLIRIRVHCGLHWGAEFLETLFWSGIWPRWRDIYVTVVAANSQRDGALFEHDAWDSGRLFHSHVPDVL